MLSMPGLMLRSQVMSPRSHRLIEVGGVEGLEDVHWTESHAEAASANRLAGPCDFFFSRPKGGYCWIMTNKFGGNDCLHYLVA